MKTDEFDIEYFITIPKMHKKLMWRSLCRMVEISHFFLIVSPGNWYFISLTMGIQAALKATLDVLETSWVLNNSIFFPLLLLNCLSIELYMTTDVLQSVFIHYF